LRYSVDGNQGAGVVGAVALRGGDWLELTGYLDIGGYEYVAYL
jgi:hypothetical protein